MCLKYPLKNRTSVAALVTGNLFCAQKDEEVFNQKHWNLLNALIHLKVSQRKPPVYSTQF